MRSIFQIIFVILGVGFFQSAQARITGNYLGQQFMINIVTNSIDGSSEVTPQNIYRSMNISPQQGSVGYGKVLKVPPKDLSFICSLKADGNYQCAFIVFLGSHAKIGLSSAYFKYTGEEAAAVWAQFKTADGGPLEISDESGVFHLTVRPDLFEIKYQ